MDYIQAVKFQFSSTRKRNEIFMTAEENGTKQINKLSEISWCLF